MGLTPSNWLSDDLFCGDDVRRLAVTTVTSHRMEHTVLLHVLIGLATTIYSVVCGKATNDT